MPDRVEQLLDGLEVGGDAGEPPREFLRAVGVRRRRRRLGQAGVVAALVLAAAGVWVGMRGPMAPQPETGPDVVGVQPPAISLVALHRANRDMDVDSLALPEAAGDWDAGSRPLRGGDPGQLDSWLSR